MKNKFIVLLCMILVSVTFVSAWDEYMNDGLFAYYHLDYIENMEEIINAYDGTIYGATLDSGGKYGNCYLFSTATDYVSTDTITFQSISFWFYVNDLSDGNRYYIVDTRGTDGTYDGFAYVNPSDAHLIFGNDWSSVSLNGNAVITDTEVISTGQWYHFVGILTTSYTKPIFFGGKFDGQGEGLNVKIDEIAVYSDDLNSSQISYLYNDGTGHFYGEVIEPNTAPVLTNPITEDINLTVGETWTYDFDCTDVNNNTITYYLLDNPPTSMIGTLNSQTGEISYTAIEGEIGSWQPTIQCNDGQIENYNSNPNFIDMNIIAEIQTTPQPSGSSAGLKMEQLTTETQAPISKISIFSLIGNFFNNILNWFKNLFN